MTNRLHHAWAISKSGSSLADTHPGKMINNKRARCAWSLLCCLAQFLEDLLLVHNSGGKKVKYLINTIVPDDTNIRMKGLSRSDKSVVCTVMNQVQACIATYDSCDGDTGDYKWLCLAMPCPLTILNTPDALNLHAAYTSFLPAGSQGIGQKFQFLGLPETTDSLERAEWVLQIMCGDALEANSSAFHVERRILASKHKAGKCKNRAAFRVKCCNHQLGLIRRPAVLSIERFWCTLVRLGHLYESASFRRRLAAGVVALLGIPGTFQRTLTLLFGVSKLHTRFLICFRTS